MMTAERKQPRCETCPFWERVKDTNSGPCRWEPPRIVAGTSAYIDDPPYTRDSDWCRHHPDAPRIVTVRGSVVWNADGVATKWREWTEVERGADDAE